MMKGTEERIGRHYCELLQPLHYRHLTVVETDAPNKYFETVKEESGMKLGKFWHGYKVFEGRRRDRFV